MGYGKKSNSIIKIDNKELGDKINEHTTRLAELVTVSITEHGAKTDAPDNTEAVNRAIDELNSTAEAATLFIPYGVFKAAGPFNQINNFRSVMGVNGSVIAHEGNNDLFRIQGRKHTFSYFEIRGKSVYTPDMASFPLQNGITAIDTNIYDCIFEKMKIACGRAAISANFANSGYFFNNVIDNCNFSDNGIYSIYLKGPNSWSWIHSNTFRNSKMESNGRGGILISGFESSQNNKFENILFDNNGSKYAVETDERFGIYDDTTIYFYNNVYDNLYFENIKVPSTHNIDSNDKVGALIIANDFDKFTIEPCVFSNNTRNIYMIVGGTSLLSNKVGTCEIKQGLFGNSDTAMNQKELITVKGNAPKTIFADIVKTYGGIKNYKLPDGFIGRIINRFEEDRNFFRQNVSTTHKVFVAKIDKRTQKNIFNTNMKLTSYFDHDNTYNQQSLYAEHIILANRAGTVTIKELYKVYNGDGGNLIIKFFKDTDSLYVYVAVFNREAYPNLRLKFQGQSNKGEVLEITHTDLFSSYDVSGNPIPIAGITEVIITP